MRPNRQHASRGGECIFMPFAPAAAPVNLAIPPNRKPLLLQCVDQSFDPRMVFALVGNENIGHAKTLQFWQRADALPSMQFAGSVVGSQTLFSGFLSAVFGMQGQLQRATTHVTQRPVACLSCDMHGMDDTRLAEWRRALMSAGAARRACRTPGRGAFLQSPAWCVTKQRLD